MANSEVYNYKKSYTTYWKGEERREPAEGILGTIHVHIGKLRGKTCTRCKREKNSEKAKNYEGSPSLHSLRAPLFTFCRLTPFLAFRVRGIRLFIIIHFRICHKTTSLCGGE